MDFDFRVLKILSQGEDAFVTEGKVYSYKDGAFIDEAGYHWTIDDFDNLEYEDEVTFETFQEYFEDDYMYSMRIQQVHTNRVMRLVRRILDSLANIRITK